MNDLQTTTTTALQTHAIQLDWIADFLAYIDRGERTERAYITNLRQFFAWLLYTGTKEPTRADIIAYRDYLSAEHDAIKLDLASPQGWTYRTDASGNPIKVTCKASTRKQYLQTVRQFFNWLAATGRWQNVAANIHAGAKKAKWDRHKKEALKPADVLKIEKSIDRSTEQGKRLFAMYLLAVNVGMRTIELSRANIKDIKEIDGLHFIDVYGKGCDEPEQRKAIAPPVYDALQEYISSRTDRPTKDSPLFVATGNRSGGKRIASTTISTMLKRAMQAAGFDSESLTAHSLRHSCGNTVMEITGDNLFQAQKYMRHANPKTTEIYLHRDDAKNDADIAQRLFDKYHDTEADSMQQIADLLKTMSEDQLQQLAGLAQDIAR